MPMTGRIAPTTPEPELPRPASDDVKAPDHVDVDGPWWSLAELPRWWVRTGPDGTLYARHRARPDSVRDVIVPAGAQEPGRLLIALCGSAEFGAAHPDLTGSA